MAFGGTFLKLFQTILYAIEFCCAGIILGIFSYFLSVLADRDLEILTRWKAVEGLSGVAVLYTAFAVLLTCFLGGKTFFAFLAVVFDVLFAGAFVAIAVLTRDGASGCSGQVYTPLGEGQSDSKEGFQGGQDNQNQITYAASLGTACRLNTVCFAVAIIGAVLFLVSALIQVAIGRNHKKEKRYGPSPANGYTRGSGIKFFGRRKARKGAVRDPEMAGAVPASHSHLAPGAPDYRPAHDTAYTGSTVAAPGATYENTHKPLSGGYHTAPTGTYNTPATNY